MRKQINRFFDAFGLSLVALLPPTLGVFWLYNFHYAELEKFQELAAGFLAVWGAFCAVIGLRNQVASEDRRQAELQHRDVLRSLHMLASEFRHAGEAIRLRKRKPEFHFFRDHIANLGLVNAPLMRVALGLKQQLTDMADVEDLPLSQIKPHEQLSLSTAVRAYAIFEILKKAAAKLPLQLSMSDAALKQREPDALKEKRWKHHVARAELQLDPYFIWLEDAPVREEEGIRE
ncbi:hypothetical protein [Agrobacterium rosae]|uniref:hypothetical protein n=1 Tax=Agrobacterium rosae TaxID=1972867 RepID=UPI0020338CFD|nr:hypothetical protein [Agrobacterium rosae]MCM2436328.1 hypothetical protein [Agrobacterium rosae]